jgi:hypothetical protein
VSNPAGKVPMMLLSLKDDKELGARRGGWQQT